MKKFFKAIYYILLAILVAIILLLLVSILPVKGNLKLLVVKSGSMSPTISTGSLIITKPSASYQLDDIITYPNPQDPQTPITHRIVKIQDNQYQTKGDANKSSDQNLVKPQEVIGKVIFDLPYAGYIVAAARQPVIFVIIILVPVGIIIYDEVKKIRREVKKIKNKKSQTEDNEDS